MRSTYQLFVLLSTKVILARLGRRLDDGTERCSRSRIKTLNYECYTLLVRMVKITRSRRPEALA